MIAPARTYPVASVSPPSDSEPSVSSLQLQQMRFAALLESTHDAVIAIDRRGRIIFWNQAATRVFGHSAEEALNSSIDSIMPAEFVPAHRAGLRRVANGGEQHVIGKTVELRGKRKDGNTFPLELSLSSWEIDGQLYFAGIIRDISERKRHERVILESEQKFRSITETASDAIISANQHGNIVSWNEAAYRIFGYQEHEAIHQPLEMIIPAKFREQYQNRLSLVASRGEQKVIGHVMELEGLHKDGYTFPMELSLSSWQTEEGIHFCGIVRDISERRKHELALEKNKEKLSKQTKKLRSANKQIREKTTQLQSLSQKLAKYLSRQVFNSIFEGDRDVKIESYRKKLTVFFSDIQGFTELSDSVEAEVLTRVLNSYLNEMSKIANEHGGTIDKFIGDAIMIFFGDPETRGVKEDALACVYMALDMQKRLKVLQRKWESMGINRPLQVRMGINTGYCTVGNFGSEERMDYTIVGTDVNLAHRLETHAEINQILISHNTWLLIKEEIACTSKHEIQVKGFADPIPTYQVIGARTSLEQNSKALIQQLEGFALDLDPALLKSENKSVVKHILEQALMLVEE